MLLGVTTGTCHRSLLRRVEGARAWLPEPGRPVPNVNNEITVACSSWSFPARPHSLGSPACPWGQGARGCACARSYALTADSSSAAEISWAVRTASRNMLFFQQTVRFSGKITTPPQVLELQVHTPEQLQARVAAVAPEGVRGGGFKVADMCHDSATAVSKYLQGRSERGRISQEMSWLRLETGDFVP